MAAVVVARRRQKDTETNEAKNADTKHFVENLPPVEFREVDTVLGTLLLG